MDIQSYLDTLKSYEPSMIRTRRDLHRHAETGWLEYRTTALLIKKLKEHGIPVKYGKEIINKDYLWAYPSESVRKSAIDRALAEGARPGNHRKNGRFHRSLRRDRDRNAGTCPRTPL